jgi:peptidylprolyl isomerase
MSRRTARWRGAAALLLAAVASCSPAPDSAPPTPAIPAPADVAAPPPNSLKTTSGLSTRVLEKGSGQRHPRATDTVVVHYTGWTTDGVMFDSSVQRGEPSEFRLNGVIPGWTEGVQMMVEGEKRRFWIPARLAYEGQPGKPQGLLVFDIELIDIK